MSGRDPASAPPLSPAPRRAGMATLAASGFAVALLAALAVLRAFLAGQGSPSPLPGGAAAIGAVAAVALIGAALVMRWLRRPPQTPETQDAQEGDDAVDRA